MAPHKNLHDLLYVHSECMVIVYGDYVFLIAFQACDFLHTYSICNNGHWTLSSLYIILSTFGTHVFIIESANKLIFVHVGMAN